MIYTKSFITSHGLASHPLPHSRACRDLERLNEHEVEIPLEANGETSWLIELAFPAADTSDFAGSVRYDAVGEGLFTAVALESRHHGLELTRQPAPIPSSGIRDILLVCLQYYQLFC